MPDRRRGRRRWVLGVAGVVGLAAIGWFGIDRLMSAPPPSACSVTGNSGQTYVLTPIQAQNASTIAAVAMQKGLPDHAVTVALAAAMQESKLANIDHGDEDSLGLFQQRPSQGWGTPAQIMDPAYAAAAFYNRLVGVPHWESLAVGDVAQAVQLSAAPDAYAPWEPQARAVARALTGEIPTGLTCQLSDWGGSAPGTGALSRTARAEFGHDVIGPVLAGKTGWAVAAWAVAHAWTYHVGRIGFAGRAWDSSSGAWTADSSFGNTVVAQS